MGSRQLKRRARLLAVPVSALLVLATVVLGNGFAGTGTPAGYAAAQRAVTIRDMHALIFVWASGMPAVQQVAAHQCAQLRLSTAQCDSVSGAVRAAWLDLAGRDPAAVGRPETHPNLAGRALALGALANQLTNSTSGHVAELLTATQDAYAAISQLQWIRAHVTSGQTLPAGTELVWATSYSQSSLPKGLNTRKSPYAALPDAYIKYANWGTISSIPTIYQPYYAPTGGAAHWTVNIANANATRSVSNVLITDVGPWNEDDNWWDANGASATPPASCPVATTLVAPDATSNPLVNGICPNGGNLRRIYYYLLYQHDGLPFFQAAGYAPTGSFQDGTAWPTALPQYCSEAAAASQNSDGITCYSGGYNTANGGWLRNGTYNAGIANQASIDVSPAVDKALGWVYPSSGLVQVSVSGLP
jgi:hypothetical protein